LVTEPPCLCFCQRERAFTAILPMTCLGEHFKYRKYPYIMKEYSVSEKNIYGIDCNNFFLEACESFWFFPIFLYHKKRCSNV